ncbi:hypothetical protein [Methylomagnum ishizawai]|uniref:hypothetical protein n=1 Tax=Methylomagnum ishizawai TaxID=1760988 RepID=UPI001C322D4F|nr:hypothetical protein [Methylomagnum ishizawai]BBL75964.1 hypothetical protein MishRS11D_30620 [Methylomagnum ishizawai]
MADYTLEIPESLLNQASRIAEQTRISVNQLLISAIAEKISALQTEAYFHDRQARGDLAAFDAWLSASPDAPPMEGDELEHAVTERCPGPTTTV